MHARGHERQCMQVTAGSPESSSDEDDISGSLSDEVRDEEVSPESKSKGRFKKFLKKFRMTSVKTKDDGGGGKRASGHTARLTSPPQA
jgi:hypothetical protein